MLILWMLPCLVAGVPVLQFGADPWAPWGAAYAQIAPDSAAKVPWVPWITLRVGSDGRYEHLRVCPLVQCLYPPGDRALHRRESCSHLAPRTQLLYAIFINVNAGSSSAVQAGHHGLFKVFKGWYNIYPQVPRPLLTFPGP